MYFKQIQEIINKALGIEPGKDQTRRACKQSECDPDGLLISGEIAVDIDGNLVITHLGERMSDNPIYAVYNVHQGERRLKWQVGRDYAVSPGRGNPGVWWKPATGAFRDPRELIEVATEDGENSYDTIAERGYKPLRNRITEIRREPLRDISEADAKAEGVNPVISYRMEYYEDGAPLESYIAGYRHLWNEINGKRSWDNTGDVWAITFEVVRV